MLKDIFIDNDTLVHNFTVSASNDYKKLMEWLKQYDEDSPEDNAYLIISNKFQAEYGRSFAHAGPDNTVVAIIDQLTREERLKKKDNREIRIFMQEHFKNRVVRNLRSNRQDWDHIAVVMLSNRRYALTADNNLCYDINHFQGFDALAACDPQHIPYDK